MNISEDEIKKFLERLLPLQESEQQTLCPRCGLHELYTCLLYTSTGSPYTQILSAG